ncbi:MAG TPA: sigma-70 family RNA polymerase sigma factor [Terriglobales bacterium]|nr:sigma-70 family RNA polymerase sigma factor [Terriglobales bacterium]
MNQTRTDWRDSPQTEARQRESLLIERVLRGEKDCFYDLIRPYEGHVYVAAFSILKNQADAEDVTQETFLKAFRHLKEFRGESRFHTWLVRIAINEARMRYRKDRRHLYDSLDETADDEQEAPHQRLADWREVPSQALERTEVREAVARAIEQLPETYREVLLLRDAQQLSIAETAEVLGVTPATVKIRLFRARVRMRKLLAPELARSLRGREEFEKGRKPW